VYSFPTIFDAGFSKNSNFPERVVIKPIKNPAKLLRRGFLYINDRAFALMLVGGGMFAVKIIAVYMSMLINILFYFSGSDNFRVQW